MSMSWKQRIVAGSTLGLIAFGAFATPAHAEGSWSSSISNWLTGKESRQWTDNNTDSVSTTVSLSGCSIPNGQRFENVTLGLYRDRSVLPDVSKGERTNACGNFGWGDVEAGTYHFTLKKINGSTGGLGHNFSATGVTTKF
jgi:hypothetical protein